MRRWSSFAPSLSGLPLDDAADDCMASLTCSAVWATGGPCWWSLRVEPRLFNDLRRRFDGISQQMLTRTLKLIECGGMIKRTVAATTPPQVEYALNDLGWSLSEAVHQLAGWAASHLATIHRNPSHYDAKHYDAKR